MRKTNIDEHLSENGTITITFVGDSITHGLNFCTADETYVAVFASLLAKEFKNASVYRYDGVVVDEQSPLSHYDEVLVQDGKCGRINVIRSGVGGNTVARALKRFDDYTSLLPAEKSDFIFTMFGINDALKSDVNKYVTPEVFKQKYNKLICDLKDSEPQAEIILMTATTSSETIDEHNKKTFELAKENNLSLIDLYELWNNHYKKDSPNFGYGDWLSDSGDPWHPSPIGAKNIAQFIYDVFFENQ